MQLSSGMQATGRRKQATGSSGTEQSAFRRFLTSTDITFQASFCTLFLTAAMQVTGCTHVQIHWTLCTSLPVGTKLEKTTFISRSSLLVSQTNEHSIPASPWMALKSLEMVISRFGWEENLLIIPRNLWVGTSRSLSAVRAPANPAIKIRTRTGHGQQR